MVQIGVYGLGGISRRVIQGVLFSRNANLYAVCSSSIEKADAYKEEYGAKKAYDNYENMLQDTNIDMIYICTPNYFVRQIICMPNIFSWHWQIINM